jgi:hypothetical protein
MDPEGRTQQMLLLFDKNLYSILWIPYERTAKLLGS